MKIKDLMVQDVKTCFASNDLATAARLMWEHDCGCIPVLDDYARVVGMITDRDICMAVFFQGVPMSEINVSSVMSRQLFVCSSDDDLSAAEKVMSIRNVRRLPVLDETGRLVGLISVSDIVGRAEQERAQRVKSRTVTDTEVARLTAAVSKPRHAGRRIT